jgi:predicted ATPase
MADTLKKLTIEGFKSIRKLEDFPLQDLNVLIGANGAGKSNFVSFFRLLREMVEHRLQVALATAEGGATLAFTLGPLARKTSLSLTARGRRTGADKLVSSKW